MTEEIKLTFKKPVALSTEMKEALANCYSFEGFRKYLDNMINSLVVLSAMKSKNEVELAEKRGGIEIATKILGQARDCYYLKEKILEMEKKKLK